MLQDEQPTLDGRSVQAEQEFISSLRFDLQGFVFQPNPGISTPFVLRPQPFLADVDTFASSLHHHGDEAHRAGYTLPELIHLCRSAFPQQRALALSLLSRLLSHALSSQLLPSREECSVVLRGFVLGGGVGAARFALGDSHHTALCAAINLVHSLTVREDGPPNPSLSFITIIVNIIILISIA